LLHLDGGDAGIEGGFARVVGQVAGVVGAPVGVRRLLPISAEVRSASEEALNKLRSSEAELAAARQRLILFGMSAQRIDRLTATQITGGEE